MDPELWAFFGIIGYVLGLAWISRHVAIEMDARGKAGWLYGMLTFFLPPLGLALWLLDRGSDRDLGRLLPRPGQK